MQQQSPVSDGLKLKSKWTIEKYADDGAFAAGRPYETVEIDGNLGLNEGIALALDLMIGAGGTPWNNASAYLGVGDSSTAAAAAQTGLQASSNKTYKAMEATYPSRSGQTVTWRSVFGSADANYAWAEFTVVNASTDSGTNLNRKVDSQGTKASGQTWTLSLAITMS